MPDRIELTAESIVAIGQARLRLLRSISAFAGLEPKLASELALVYRNELRKAVPVGEHNPGHKGGAARRSITHRKMGSTYRFFGIYYLKWVIEGRRGFGVKTPGVRALRFYVMGKAVFRRSVGPAKANDFREKAVRNAQVGVRVALERQAIRVARGL